MQMKLPTSLCVLVIAASLVVGGCYDPTSDTAQTEAQQAKTEKKVVVKKQDLVFPLDADNCDIKWTGSNTAGMTPHGFFYELTGKLVVDGDSKQPKHLELDIKMDSVKAMASSLTEKLKNKGFFEVEKFPRSTFNVTSVLEPREDDKEDVTNVLEGNFQLRDVTKSIQIPVVFSMEDNGNAKLVSEFSFNRKDYGVVHEVDVEDLLIRDNVLINLEIEAEPGTSE